MGNKLNLSLRSYINEGGATNRKAIYNFYFNKYFNLYMNAYKWNGIDYQQSNYIMRKFWADGRVAAFNVKFADAIGFAPFAEYKWNMYDYPEEVNLINERGVPFIPNDIQIVDKDVVLGWTQRNKKPVALVVDLYARKLADIDMTIRTNLKAHKTPWLIGVAPEDRQKVTALFNKIEKDDSELFVDLEDVNNFKSLVSGAPYIIDKLYAYKCALENELKEYLGITNLGNQEKKEHLITSEVNANSEVTEASGDCFYDVLVEFTQRIKEVLGFSISVELNKPEQYYESEETSPDNEEEENNVQI